MLNIEQLEYIKLAQSIPDKNISKDDKEKLLEEINEIIKSSGNKEWQLLFEASKKDSDIDIEGIYGYFRRIKRN